MDTQVQFSELNTAIKRHIKQHESDLNKKCRKLWHFTNDLGEKFLFGLFGKLQDEDNTIVTIATSNWDCCGGWEPQWN